MRYAMTNLTRAIQWKDVKFSTFFKTNEGDLKKVENVQFSNNETSCLSFHSY